MYLPDQLSLWPRRSPNRATTVHRQRVCRLRQVGGGGAASGINLHVLSIVNVNCHIGALLRRKQVGQKTLIHARVAFPEIAGVRLVAGVHFIFVRAPHLVEGISQAFLLSGVLLHSFIFHVGRYTVGISEGLFAAVRGREKNMGFS